jgi:CHAT domain-containing protein
LARRTVQFRHYREAQKLTPAGLKALLPEGAILVDFMEYGTGKDARLVAFVVGREKIERIELGESGLLGGSIDGFRRTMNRTQPVIGSDDSALVLRDKIWTPLAKHLGGAKLVLISPDGPLNRLPFTALPAQDGKRYLIEEVALAVLPVPHMLPELLAPRDPGQAKTGPSLLVVGDVDFDGLEDTGTKVAKVEILGSGRPRAGGPMKWDRLPGTRTEVASIEDTFRRAVPGGQLTSLREKQATVDSVRQLASRHRYLHFATHGFFTPKEIKSALQTEITSDALLLTRETRVGSGPHPGLLSGLVFAGANRPASDGDGGVLTALDVAELDLSKVELTVLSACETGLGAVAGGEGVLGLQRAFQVAGARTVVTSLWKVDDLGTRRLMERYYENYWKKEQGSLQALREAQLWMLEEGMLEEGIKRGMVRKEDGRPKGSLRTPPEYWAAFVLSGDWR